MDHCCLSPTYRLASVVPSSRHTDGEVLFVHSATRPRCHSRLRSGSVRLTRGRACHHYDASAQQSGIGPGSSVSRRRTNIPGVSSSPRFRSCSLRDRVHQRIDRRASTQRPGLGATIGSTRGRGCPRCDASVQESAIACLGFVSIPPPLLFVQRSIATAGSAQNTAATVVGPTTISTTKPPRSRHIY